MQVKFSNQRTTCLGFAGKSSHCINVLCVFVYLCVFRWGFSCFPIIMMIILYLYLLLNFCVYSTLWIKIWQNVAWLQMVCSWQLDKVISFMRWFINVFLLVGWWIFFRIFIIICCTCGYWKFNLVGHADFSRQFVRQIVALHIEFWHTLTGRREVESSFMNSGEPFTF